MLSPLPDWDSHLYLSFNKSPRPAVICQGRTIKRPRYHLASDSPTHSATQRLALLIPFFPSFFLTHAKSRIPPVNDREQLSAHTDTQLIPPSKEKKQKTKRKTEPMRDMLGVTNPASLQTAGSRQKPQQRSGKKEKGV